MTTAIVGWSGTMLCLFCHARLSFGRMQRGPAYFAANAVASVLVCISSWLLSSWQAVVMNGFWLCASVAGYFGVELALGGLASRRSLFILCAALAVGAGVVALSDLHGGIRWLGWAAIVLFCGSYLLLAVERLTQRDFLACNAVAAMSLLPVLVLDANWPVVALEATWGVLSVLGLVRRNPAV